MEGSNNHCELDTSGPFITVVSVDGGCNFGNKLTVITPSEINENCNISNSEFVQTWKEIDDKQKIQNENNNQIKNEDEFMETVALDYNNEHDENTCGGAYVTVLALGKKQNDDKNNTTRTVLGGPGNGEQQKSIVNIFNENEKDEFLPYDDITNDDFIFDEPSEQEQPIAVLRRQRSIVSIEEKAPEIIEQVIVYRLPGERLGFGLRFEGGVTNPSENVRRLFIQSCAEDSPAWRTRTSWDSLVEGDEILEIERVPVNSMTRMDCVQSLKDSSVAVNLLVRHFYSSTEIQLITKAKLLGTSEDRLTTKSMSNTSTPEPYLDELRDEEIQIFEQDKIKKKSSRRRKLSSSHSLSAESAYGSCNTNSDMRLSSSLSQFSTISTSSADDNYYEKQLVYECEQNQGNKNQEDQCVTIKHKLLLEVDNNNGVENSYEMQMPPQVLSRKLLPTRSVTNTIESVSTHHHGYNTTSSSPNDLNLDWHLKPPAGFDDSVDWQLNNNGLIFPDSVLDIMNMSDLLIEAERIRFALNNETAALLSSTDDNDGDGTASTRSTVISRLSMASSAAAVTTSTATSTFTLDNNHSMIGRSSSNDTYTNVYPQAMLRSGLDETRMKNLIPLEPPLCFQDDGEGDDAPFQMPVTSVNIIHSHGQTFEQEYYDDPDSARCFTSNSVSDGMWSPYPNPDEDELSLFAQELGQDDVDNNNSKIISLCENAIDTYNNGNINFTKFQDDEDNNTKDVMIRVEWLHEIEEQVQTLEAQVFPFVKVVRGKRNEIENDTRTGHNNEEEVKERNTHYWNANGKNNNNNDEVDSMWIKKEKNSKPHYEQNEFKLKYNNNNSNNNEKFILHENTEPNVLQFKKNDIQEEVIEPIEQSNSYSKRPKVTSSSQQVQAQQSQSPSSFLLLSEVCEVNQRRVEHQYENIEAQFTEQLYSQQSQEYIPPRSSSRNSLSFIDDEKVKVIEVHVKKDTLQTLNQSSSSSSSPSSSPSPCPSLNESTYNNNNKNVVLVVPEVTTQNNHNNIIMTEMTTTTTTTTTRKELLPSSLQPPPIVTRRNKIKKIGGHCHNGIGGFSGDFDNNSIGSRETPSPSTTTTTVNGSGGGGGGGGEGLDDQVEQRMMNQILLMRPRPIATIQQVDKSPTLIPLTKMMVMMPDTTTTTTPSTTTTTGDAIIRTDLQSSKIKTISSTTLNKFENKLLIDEKETSTRRTDYSFEERRQVHEEKNFRQEQQYKSNEKLVRQNSFSSVEDFDESSRGGGAVLVIETTAAGSEDTNTTKEKNKKLSKSLSHTSITTRNNVDFPGGNLTGAIPSITHHLSYGTTTNSSVLLIGTQSQGSSAEGAEGAFDTSEETVSNLDRRTPGMDSSSDIYHPFIPPTFSRLPPDGDEFPNSWSDEKNNTHSNDKYNMYDTNHHSNNSPASKLYRSELNLHNMTVFGNPPPPPIPMSEPPSDDQEGCPPPLPVSIPPPHPQSRLLTRKSSVEDRKRLFEPPNSNVYNPKIGHVSRAQEPSKKSVKDKIAMFSTRSSSKEDTTDSTLPTVFQSNNNNKSTSLPRVPDSSRLSKSSDNLPGNGGMSLPRDIDNDLKNGKATTTNSWKMNTTTVDMNREIIPRKISNTDDSVQLRNPGKYENNDNTNNTTNLSERSQSMIDVGGEHGNFYQMSYKYNSPIRNSAGPTNASSIMEQRRKCMSKLRGLVIPDKLEGVNGTMSVVDLPTIISKDAPLISNSDILTKVSKQYTMPTRQLVSRTDSLDGMSSSDDTCAKTHQQRPGVIAPVEVSTVESDFSDWKLPSALPKYSPAFKRRSLTPYQTAITSPTMKPRVSANFKMSTSTTPEPKSLESLTSPRSDSSFEYMSPSPINNEPRIVAVTTVSSMPKRNSIDNGKVKMTEIQIHRQNSNSTAQSSTEPSKKSTDKGKLEDSDNDSAVSSSRSSISHELSPPNSPTPGESSSTPDPDVCLQRKNSETQQNMEINNAEQDSANNSDEGWRILKPQSVEAINRKNVLTSSKFSSGVGERSDDGSTSSGKNRRSDDEEASYADAETEDTESSCSELEVSKTRRRPTHHVHGHGVRRNSKATNDTEEEEEIEQHHISPSHSQQSSLDFGDMMLNLPGLTETPLQAIFDMEAKMAYINEICDALPSSCENSSRYFIRRDSEQTVIENPIERKMSAASDQTDAIDRRARNRSSSGNESDFSSSISVASQGQNQQQPQPNQWSASLSSGPSSSNLEKKYSKSLTSVNLLSNKQAEVNRAIPATVVPSAPVPKIISHASGIVEQKIERIIEKTSTTDGNVKKMTGTSIPRGRNDFKSLSEKWQQISNTEQGKPVASSTPIKPTPIFEPPVHPVQQGRRNLGMGTSSSTSAAVESDVTWVPRRRFENTRNSTGNTSVNDPPILSVINATKRSVSVNDIRRAFEKAEIAVNSYGRDDNSDIMMNKSKDSSAILSPPSAHFRVSSFDSTTSEDSSATTPAGIYGSVNSLISSVPRDPYGSITSLASSTSLISAQELQQLIDDANQSLEEAGTPSHEVSVVILHREFAGGSLGITLAGGADYETKEITVHKVLTGSIADRDGRIHRGDRVLSITGKSTKGLTHREALNLLKAPRTEVVLVVSRGRSASNGFETIEETSATLDRAVEPLLNGSLASLLENDEDINYKWGPTKTVILIKDGAGLGFSLDGGKGSISGDMPLTVKKIFVGGPAEKSGELKVGDLITTINNVNMSTKSRTEAWNFMKKLGDGDVKIIIRSPF